MAKKKKTEAEEEVVKAEETKKATTKKTTTKKTTAKKTTTKATTKKTSKKAETEEAPAPTVAYKDSDLAEFKEVILRSREEAMDELQMLKDRLEDLQNYDFAEESMIYSMHMAEQGSEAMEKEKTYAQIQRIHEYIKKLDDALERIKEKTYGICRVCGCLIAKERLLAVPITTLSAAYKIHQKCPDDGIDRIEARK